MNENTFVDLLMDTIYSSEEADQFKAVSTYEQAGVMSYNNGLVIKMKDGSEFQLTIVQSK